MMMIVMGFFFMTYSIKFVSFQNYYVVIAKQMTEKKKDKSYGIPLTADQMECFSDEQMLQLFELMKETKKPSVSEEQDAEMS